MLYKKQGHLGHLGHYILYIKFYKFLKNIAQNMPNQTCNLYFTLCK